MVERQISDTVTFLIHSRDKRTADYAIKLLETAIVDDHIEKSIADKIIKDLSNDQVKCKIFNR